VSKKDYKKLLSEYYDKRGWNKKTGLPTQKKLKELGLGFVIKDLKKKE